MTFSFVSINNSLAYTKLVLGHKKSSAVLCCVDTVTGLAYVCVTLEQYDVGFDLSVYEIIYKYVIKGILLAVRDLQYPIPDYNVRSSLRALNSL